MNSVLGSVGKGKKAKRLGEVETVDRARYQGLEVDAKVELIRGLIPLGLMHVQELLDEEVRSLAGERYARGDDGTAWEQPRLGAARRAARTDPGAASARRRRRDPAAYPCGVAGLGRGG